MIGWSGHPQKGYKISAHLMTDGLLMSKGTLPLPEWNYQENGIRHGLISCRRSFLIIRANYMS